MSAGLESAAERRDSTASSATWDRQDCETFLLHEARLLDEAKFDAWLALFTADAQYWVPSEPDQKSPYDTVSLIYDDRRLAGSQARASILRNRDRAPAGS